MKKNFLIASAVKLVQPTQVSADEFSRKKEVMTAQVIQMLNARSDLDRLIGDGNRAMMVDNAYNMARFMESLFRQYNPHVLVETVLWVFRAYRSHGFQLTFWPAHLNAWIETLEKELPDSCTQELLPFYVWMQINIPIFVSLTDEITPDKED